LEARNIVFNGAMVVEGGCLAVAIRIGDNTLISHIVNQVETNNPTSTLKTDMDHFIKILVIFALIQALCVFAVGLYKGLDFITIFVTGFVIIMIGNVPQGLPTTVAQCLFIIANQMQQNNILVRKIGTIETLGSCSLICTDKTGTLTVNSMSVSNMWVYNIRCAQNEFVTQLANSQLNGQFRKLLTVASLNSRIILQNTGVNDNLQQRGNATELGLYRFCAPLIPIVFQGIHDIEAFRTANNKVFEIPFTPEHRWQLSIHRQSDDLIMLLKGAPEIVLEKCTMFLGPYDGVFPIGQGNFINAYGTAYNFFGGQGERVLGFATMKLDDTIFKVNELEKPDFQKKMMDYMTSPDNKDFVFVVYYHPNLYFYDNSCGIIRIW
jgi:sodium/potassium-transporting ATPase subunit alpha